jgi:hypothetical protein
MLGRTNEMRNFLLGSDERETSGTLRRSEPAGASDDRGARELFLAMECVVRCQAGEAVRRVERFVGDGYYQNRDHPEHGISLFSLSIDSDAGDENVSGICADSEAAKRGWLRPTAALEHWRGAEFFAAREIIGVLCYGNRMGPEYKLGAWQAAQSTSSPQPACVSNQELSHRLLYFLFVLPQPNVTRRSS